MVTGTQHSDSNHLDPWELVWGQPYIRAAALADAIEQDLARTARPDFRTRLLVRDAARALKSYWGNAKFDRWLRHSSVGNRVGTILAENLGKPGFTNIRRRLVASFGRDRLEQILDLLGQRVHTKVQISIAGSIPTLVSGLTVRPTNDIDIIDEVPKELRTQRELLSSIKTKFSVTLGHVQSHYLPTNWSSRRHYFGKFGGLHVYLADAYDIFVSKLSSRQEKHLDDLIAMAPKLDKEAVRRLLLSDGKPFLESRFTRPTIEENWRFLFRESLFPQNVKEPAPKIPAKKKTRQSSKRNQASRKKKSE